MSFESLEEIISYAIEQEKEAALFYEECSRKEPFTGSKATLEDMAKEERKHQDLLENLGKAEGVPTDYKFKWIPDMKRSDYMVEMEYEQGMHYTDILRLAMKREEKALKLYNELLSKSDDPNHKRVFKMLCQEEAKHKKFLETLYDDYMACQGD
ncbi:rubrerythrin [Desulfobacteraceae bacterium SEEP-SAG9]|nr:rubrerythrin [Desulfobacteraceae bacterium SEEP-SAG9]